jgi:ABC-type transport system involved in multi-copper enzyme maturation, permease component
MPQVRANRIGVFLAYEYRRAIARRKVVALVVFTVLLDTVPYYALVTNAPNLIPPQYHPYVWVIGVYAPLSIFLQFIAILIAAGAMSEEYEQGTAELLLSKPVSKAEYFVGKYLGGYTLLLTLILLNSTLTVLSAYTSFGVQLGLGALPYVLLGECVSSSVFFSLAFMVGELVRRSSLSYIISSAIFFTSEILGVYFGLISSITGSKLYLHLERVLPTSPVDSLPIQLGVPRLPAGVGTLLTIVGPSQSVETSILASVGLIAAYVFSGVFIAYAYFSYMDVSKKIS